MTISPPLTIDSGVVYEAEFDAPAGITFSDGVWLLNGDPMAQVLPSSVTLMQVPEPSVVAFLSLALAGIVVRRRFKYASGTREALHTSGRANVDFLAQQHVTRQTFFIEAPATAVVEFIRGLRLTIARDRI